MADSKLQSVLPYSEQQFEEDLSYGIEMSVYGQFGAQEAVLCIHPHERRFLMLTNKVSRNIQILDWETLLLLPHSFKKQATSIQLKRNHCKNQNLYSLNYDLQILLSGTRKSRNETFERMRNLQKILMGLHLSTKVESTAMRLFYFFNENGDGVLQRSELQNLLRTMHIPFGDEAQNVAKKLSPGYANGRDGEGVGLTKQEFQLFFKTLAARKELVGLFQKHCPGFRFSSIDDSYLGELAALKPMMSKSVFRQFLELEQRLDNQEIEQILSKEVQQEKLSFSDFCLFIYSQSNLAIDARKRKLYLKMDEPLTSYYVYSSHNTYLVGNQLTSESKAFRYVLDFYNGIKCVELDIHNGPDGPIIKHGFTVTSSITFEEVIHYIAQFSDLHPDHLPLILSFENHCNQRNQLLMAQILEKHLGNKVFRLPPICDNFNQTMPSPQQLRGKIVIQGTGKLLDVRPNTTYVERPAFVPTGRLAHQSSNVHALQNRRKLNQDYPNHFANSKITFIKGWVANKKALKKQFTQSIQKQIIQITAKTDTPKQDKSLMEYYSVLVAAYDNQRTCWEMANMSQNLGKAKLQDWAGIQQMTAFSKKSLIRIYPLGTRFDSSNYDPIPFMQVGAQLVSLNTQGFDPYSFMLAGNFLENGGPQGGYLLKPKYVRSNKVVKPQQKCTVQIRIISCINLSRDEAYKTSSFCCGSSPQDLSGMNAVELCVLLALFCTKADADRNPNAATQQVTEKVSSLNFDGLFKKTVTMTYNVEDVYFAHLYFCVPQCGQMSIPVRMLRSGIRTIPLMDTNKQFIQHSYLLADILITHHQTRESMND